VSESFEQIDECDWLFLAEIEELDGNGLRLLVKEGRRAGQSQDVHVAGQVIHDCTPIAVTDESAAFEIVWEHYVAYCVLNESFAFPPNGEEVYTGKRLRIYSKSRFRQYVSRSTFATDEYPGPMQHYEVCCEDHIVNVISTGVPRANQIHPDKLS
jgi:hypothetical protein